ncbi:MAG: MarR family transcriptional regulator [Caulobacteraceae bacterium]
MAARTQAVKAASAEAAASVANVSDLGALQGLIGFRLRRIQNHLSRAFAERLADRGVRPGSFSALALVAANPGISQTELSRDLGSDKASVVSLIDELEGHGWAVRQRSAADRRRHALHVTPAGKKVLREMTVVAHENEAPLHDVLSDAELAVLSEMLDRVYNRCFAYDID